MFDLLSQFFRLRFILLIAAVLISIYSNEISKAFQTIFYVNQNEALQPSETPSSSKLTSNELNTDAVRLFTKEELAKYTGENNEPIYLAIVGDVYDVSKGIKHYGPGCSYSFFAGRDASVSFISGEFENYDESLADDVLTLTPSELLSLDNWKKFYDKDYIYKGKLIGRFYDEQGERTPYYRKYLEMVKQGMEDKKNAEQWKDKYPDCNIEWTQELGTRVWCTNTSGNGKERNWTGYPRKLFELNKDGFRCACIREEDLSSTEVMIKTYDNCDNSSYECFYRVD